MKKLFVLMVAAAMTLSLTACGGGSGGSKEVELTTENIEDYLALDFELSSPRGNTVVGISFGTLQDITLSSFAVQGGSFNSAQITFEIPLPAVGTLPRFTVAESDDAYDAEDEGTLTFTVRLPANGECSETHTIGSRLSYVMEEEELEYTITEVSGTFAPSN